MQYVAMLSSLGVSELLRDRGVEQILIISSAPHYQIMGLQCCNMVAAKSGLMLGQASMEIFRKAHLCHKIENFLGLMGLLSHWIAGRIKNHLLNHSKQLLKQHIILMNQQKKLRRKKPFFLHLYNGYYQG